MQQFAGAEKYAEGLETVSVGGGRMKQRKLRTTFTKMTVSFILFGMLPLFILSLLFFFRYTGSLRNAMVSNYSQINGYFAKNVEDVLSSADTAMEALYDYQTEDGDSLTAVLKAKRLPDSERARHIMSALHEVMAKSEYISSERFVDLNGKVYALYYDQSKMLRNDAGFYNRMNIIREEQLRDLRILGTTQESNICVNSDDFIFCLVRNFMDTSSIEKTYTTPLGTLFVDVNAELINDLVKKMDLNKGRFYVYSKSARQYLYSQRQADYLNGSHPLASCESNLQGESGYAKMGGSWIFYRKIADSEVYSVLKLKNSEVIGDFFQSRLVVILILSFFCGILLILYMFFSNWMSAPIHKLKKAMEEVEEGKLDVQVQLNSRDEMEYVAEGFNKMVGKLKDYINQVYVAQICQKDAELNALKMQIQPHYLYNTLDVIRMTALEEGDDTTAELLECLAHQLRYVMGGHSERIYLEDELQMIREYFVIMKTRYEGRITLHIHVKNEDLRLVVPKMLLQPVVENAVKHGLREKPGHGTVAVSVFRRADYLEIVIMDDGVGMEEELVRHMQETLDYPEVGRVDADSCVSVGMKNVYDRIKLNCGRDYGFRIESVKGMGTIVTYRLPIWEDLQENVESGNSR